MPNKRKTNLHEILLDAHRRGIEQAIDLSIRTGVPLVIEKDGKIVKLKPKYKYVLVPIKSNKPKNPSKKVG